MKDRVNVPNERKQAGFLTEVGTSRLAGRSFSSGCCFLATFISHPALSATFSGHLRSGWQRSSEADGHRIPRGKPGIVSAGTEEGQQTRGSPSAAELGLAAHQLRVCPPLKRSCVKAHDVNPFTTQRASNFTCLHQIPSKYEQPRQHFTSCLQAIKVYSNMSAFCTTF